MSQSVSASPQVQAPTPIKPDTPKGKAAKAPPTQALPHENVTLSSAAQAALQEALETPAQTAKEAGTGDMQARRLLAKEAAEKEAASPQQSVHVVA